MPIQEEIYLKLEQNDPTLKILNLSDKQLYDDDVEYLVKALEDNTHLKILELGSKPKSQYVRIIDGKNNITDVGAIQLASLPLHVLRLDHNELSNAGAEALSKNETLVELDLGFNHITDEGMRAFSGNSILQILNIRRQKISDVGACFIASMCLKHLNLNHSKDIGDKGAIALSQIGTLEVLSLSDNIISDDGAIALASHPNIKDLCLSNNQIGDRGAQAFARNSVLTCLGLGDNKITNIGVITLAKNNVLSNLELYSNPFDDQAIVALACNQTLTDLFVSGKTITDRGVRAFFNNQTILGCYISSAQVSDATDATLNEQWERNKKRANCFLTDCGTGNWTKIKKLLENRLVSPYAKRCSEDVDNVEYSETGLDIAVQTGHLQLAQQLVEYAPGLRQHAKSENLAFLGSLRGDSAPTLAEEVVDSTTETADTIMTPKLKM